MKTNYPEAKAVSREDQFRLTEAFVPIASQYGMTVKPCGEDPTLSTVGADCSGCMTVRTFERAIGRNLSVPANPNNRKECACYLTGDIGQYDTCGHLCRYCYANSNAGVVRENRKRHDPDSPLLVGHLHPDDVIHPAKQTSWIDLQMRFDFNPPENAARSLSSSVPLHLQPGP
ncbi:MAG: DUF1848 family protein [Parasporobacterium sp.]|nr:DUF1848 family protein [Parasporobacterium sp.]